MPKKSGSPKKRNKKYPRARGAEGQPAKKTPRGITPFGKFIQDAMTEHKVSGSWKDYVLFVGDDMLDAWGKYNIIRMGPDGEPSKTAATIALLHKRDLHVAIGEAPAAKFWNKKLARRTIYGLHDYYRGKHARKAPEGGPDAQDDA